MRHFTRFHLKDSNFRICSDCSAAAIRGIEAARRALELYIQRHPAFATSFVPLAVRPDAPPAARRMALAAARVGVGPMAAVAGTIAQLAAEAALQHGATEAIVENGGDLYLHSSRAVTVGLYAGGRSPLRGIALRFEPDYLPAGVCSSSSRMGHSSSCGDCDLATVIADDSSLADAAATLACNQVRQAADIERVLEQVGRIAGIRALILVKGEKVGMSGQLPALVRSSQPDIEAAVTRDPQSGAL